MNRLVLHEMIYRDFPRSPVHLSLSPYSGRYYYQDPGGRTFEGITTHGWSVQVPEGSRLDDSDHPQQLEWELNGSQVSSSPNEIWALAHLELHGFRLLKHAPVAEI